MYRSVIVIGLAALVPGTSSAQPDPKSAAQKSALVVTVLERMDRRYEAANQSIIEANQRIVRELGEQRSAQRDMLREIGEIDRRLASVEARLSALEAKPTPQVPPKDAPVMTVAAKSDVLPVKFVPPPPVPTPAVPPKQAAPAATVNPAALHAPPATAPTAFASPFAPPPWPGQPCVVFFVPCPPAFAAPK